MENILVTWAKGKDLENMNKTNNINNHTKVIRKALSSLLSFCHTQIK